MFKKSIIFLVILCTGSLQFVKADEGMWLLSLLKKLNEADMQKLGCKLSADQIYSVNGSSMKDAYVSLGGFCTGQMISKDGLLITNHHCGLESVQEHSTPENDYLTNGFWAKTHEEELTNPGLFVKFLIRMEEVTDQVKKELSDTLNEAQFQAALPGIFAKITKAATENTTYTADVKGVFKGDEFYLFVYEVFKDVRLVGAPPINIGNFGGDTDNWMWPRHTGDFSMFRVYCSKDGKPAAYSKDNVPYTPKYFLPISISGVKEDDYAMIMGYPGGTDRYLTSAGVEMAVEVNNPAIVKIRDKKLEIINHDMKEDDAVRIKYQAKKNESSNYWKFFIGQTKQLKRMHVADKKRESEKKFNDWANADATRKAKYGTVVSDLRNAYADMRKVVLTRTYLGEAVLQGAEILPLAFGYQPLEKVLQNKESKPEEIKAVTDPLKNKLEDHFKNYNLPTDQKLFASLLKIYYNDIPKEQQAPIFREIETKYKANFDEFAEEVFKHSFFTSKEKLSAFLESPSAKKLSKDLAYRTVTSLMDYYKSTLSPQLKANDQKLSKLNRAYIKGTRELYPDKKFFPDANSTMRLSYGTVKDYDPMDAVHYAYFTTLEGIMEKMDDKFDDYKVPAKLFDLYNKKDYGRYADNGEMKVCFITNNDITGGSSGSGVVNGNGELIGLAFDGNWEAMCGDIVYDPDYKRTIVVDIRYVLFIIDKYAGATNLINEMKINGSSTASK
jgi:peptidase S46-like protein